jgi:hypothetical protein
MSVTVTSASNDPVVAAVISGADFSLTKSSCAQNEVPCLINVVFSPVGQSGVYTGTISLTDTVTGYSSEFTVSGQAINLLATPAALTFAPQKIGTMSLAQTVNLSNVQAGIGADSPLTVALGGYERLGVQLSDNVWEFACVWCELYVDRLFLPDEHRKPECVDRNHGTRSKCASDAIDLVSGYGAVAAMEIKGCCSKEGGRAAHDTPPCGDEAAVRMGHPGEDGAPGSVEG